MADVFDDIAASFADLINASVETAGFILGFATVAVFMIAFAIFLATLRVRIEPLTLVVPVAIGIAFVGLTGWWPPWAILFIVLIVAVLLTRTVIPGRDG